MTIRCKTKYNLFNSLTLKWRNARAANHHLTFVLCDIYVADCKQSYPAKLRRILIFFDFLDI